MVEKGDVRVDDAAMEGSTLQKSNSHPRVIKVAHVTGAVPIVVTPRSLKEQRLVMHANHTTSRNQASLSSDDCCVLYRVRVRHGHQGVT